MAFNLPRVTLLVFHSCVQSVDGNSICMYLCSLLVLRGQRYVDSRYIYCWVIGLTTNLNNSYDMFVNKALPVANVDFLENILITIIQLLTCYITLDLKILIFLLSYSFVIQLYTYQPLIILSKMLLYKSTLNFNLMGHLGSS